MPTIGVSLSDRSIIASAAEDDSDAPKSGKCGENVTWIFDDNGTLTISGTGPMQTTPFGIPEWEEWRSDIKKVVIEDGVTAISTTAFNGCPMSEIDIADSVESSSSTPVTLMVTAR